MSNKTILEEYIFEPLYAKDVKGKTKTWKLKVERYDTYSEIIIFHGYNNLVEVRRQINIGKNMGKSNETTHYSQAIIEAKSKWDKKLNIEKYTTNVTGNQTNNTMNPLPMLANDYKKNKEKVKSLLSEMKIMVQPKFDGYRMIYNTTTKQMSTRQGKEYNIIKESGTLYKELQKLPTGYILDGELYTNQINFEELGILRKTKNLSEQDLINLSKIEYHIYDLIDTNLVFEQRNEKIKELLYPDKYEKLIYVSTYLLQNEDEIQYYHTKFLEQGYEGTMIRNKESLYKIKQRSNDLLKYKDFDDAEYKIVDYTFEKDTSGKDENLVVWIVHIPDIYNKMIKCKVRPMGTKEERKNLYKKCIDNFDQFIGKNLWVKYFEKTKDGNLRFPSTKTNSYESYIRDDIL